MLTENSIREMLGRMLHDCFKSYKQEDGDLWQFTAELFADKLCPAYTELLEVLIALLNQGYAPIVGRCVEADREMLVQFWEREDTKGRGEAKIVLRAFAAILKAKGGA